MALETLTKALKICDLIHFLIAVVIFASAALCLFATCSALAWPTIIVADAYILALLLFTAVRSYWLLPDRFTTLFVMPLIFGALVFAFAALYVRCDCFVRNDLRIDPKTAAVNISTNKLERDLPSEALYLSLGVITTSGSNYAPTDLRPHHIMTLELGSGLLFLLAAFPVLAGRLALFNEESTLSAPNDGRIRITKADGEDWKATVKTTTCLKDSGKDSEVDVIVKSGEISLERKL